MSDCLITIVIPVYNVENYLSKCVNSVLCQTYANLEILLVNDGSTDQSGQLCDQFSKLDPRVRVIHQENQGLSGARNSGTKTANGVFITYLDSDDWFSPDTIETSVLVAVEGNFDLVFWRMMKEYSGVSLPGKVIFDGDTVFEGKNLSVLHRRLVGPIGNEMARPHLIDSFASAWGKLFKLDLIKQHKVEFVDTKVIGSEDVLFNIEYFYLCKKAYYLDRCLIHYRKDNPTSLTKTHGSTLFPRFIRLFDHISQYIKAKGLSEEYLIALNNRIAISMMNIGLSETSPRNSNDSFKQIKALHTYLIHPTYTSAYSTVQLSFLPWHWRIFYFCCKYRSASGAFLLLKAMRLFIK